MFDMATLKGSGTNDEERIQSYCGLVANPGTAPGSEVRGHDGGSPQDPAVERGDHSGVVEALELANLSCRI